MRLNTSTSLGLFMSLFPLFFTDTITSLISAPVIRSTTQTSTSLGSFLSLFSSLSHCHNYLFNISTSNKVDHPDQHLFGVLHVAVVNTAIPVTNREISIACRYRFGFLKGSVLYYFFLQFAICFLQIKKNHTAQVFQISFVQY